MHKLLIATLVTAGLSVSIVVAQTPDATPKIDPNAPAVSRNGSAEELSASKLGSGDLVEVSVFGVPELTSKTRVGARGELSLPLLDQVVVEGMTPNEAENKIEQLLVEGNFIKSPHVTVSVLEFNSAGISVMGEVMKPGIYPLLGKRRLFDVISEAGGTTPKAGKIVSITHRSTPDKPATVEMSDDPAKTATSNVEIYPGDTVVMTRAGIVYVVGEVQKPGGFMMENNGTLTVLQAIALAQGTTRAARLDKAKLIRKSANGPQEIPIDIKGILTAKRPDEQLMAEDIIFLPASAAKNATRRTLEAIMQTATGLAIYGPMR